MAASINADNGVVSGSAGLKSSADSTGVLALQTNGTTAISIDASQAVSFTNSGTVKNLLLTAGTLPGAGNPSIALRSSDNIIYHQSGSANSITFLDSAQNAMYVASATSHIWNISNAEKARIDSSGNLLVGTTTATSSSRLRVKSSDNTDNTYTIYVDNSSATQLFSVISDGDFNTGQATHSPYNYTTANAANMVVDSSGLVKRSTSSLKYKTDVTDATHGLTDLLKLRSVTYKGKNDGGTVFGGLIAEEVHDAGLTEFVQYAQDGTPDALAYGNMVSLCVKAIQEQQALITQLQADVAALKGA